MEARPIGENLFDESGCAPLAREPANHMTHRRAGTFLPDALGEAQTTASVLQALRVATSAQHQQLERLPINARLLSDDVQLPEYRITLLRLYGFYKPLSLRAQSFPTTWTSDVVTSVQALAGDLLDLNVLPPELDDIAGCETLPALTTADQALGCGYVIEGSALGGRVIARHLSKVFGGRGGVPMRFFAGDGDRAAERWRRFCAELDATANDVDDVCTGARAIFDAMAGWLNSAEITGNDAIR
jgi:heme oxygenase